MTDILKKILQTKLQEVIAGKVKQPTAMLSEKITDLPDTKKFKESISHQLSQKLPAVIAEIKKASPSKGIIRDNFNPQKIAQSYQSGGATCLSILTDEVYFQGHNSYINTVRKVTELPILRKDFIIDPWQIYQSRVLGADCVLLIVAALDDPQLLDLTQLAHELKMDVLTEVHNTHEMKRALKTPTKMIGINNRNLHTFETSIQTSIQLTQNLQTECIIVSESGISCYQDIEKLQQNNIHTYLIGESFMREQNPGEAMKNMIFNHQNRYV